MKPSKERLLHLLAEAAELEHNLLCSYLFALFSLKEEQDEDLNAQEFARIGEWRKNLTGVCIEEMSHLAQITNLTAAIGSRPHFDRPNIPVSPGYHPASIAVELTPLDFDTLTHFAFLERPAGHRMDDGAGFAPATPFVRLKHTGTLMPSAPNYETIGEFYDVIKSELRDYAAQFGESRLFSGPKDFQLRPQELHTDALIAVDGLADALAAIDEIVREGEGSASGSETSHFAMFMRMRDQHEQLSLLRPGFAACRNVGRNPVMHAPVEHPRTHVVDADASRLLDAANAAYGLMLRFLARTYETPWQQEVQRKKLLDGCIGAMKLVSLLGRELTKQRASPHADARAGISFAMLRATEGPQRLDDALPALAERACEIVSALADLPLPTATIEEGRQLLAAWSPRG